MIVSRSLSSSWARNVSPKIQCGQQQRNYLIQFQCSSFFYLRAYLPFDASSVIVLRLAICVQATERLISSEIHIVPFDVGFAMNFVLNRGFYHFHLAELQIYDVLAGQNKSRAHASAAAFSKLILELMIERTASIGRALIDFLHFLITNEQFSAWFCYWNCYNERY